MRDFLRRLFGGAAVTRDVTYEQGRAAGLVPMDGTPGGAVTVERAMSCSPVFAAVRRISAAAAGLPIHCYRSLPNDDRQRADDNPAYRVLRAAPNPVSVPFTFWAWYVSCILLHGNGFAEIEFSEGGDPLALWPLPPERVRIGYDSEGNLGYEVRTGTGEPVVLPADRVFHVPYVTSDGVSGKGIVQFARDCVGLLKAQETGAVALFANMVRPSGAVETPPGMSDQAKKNIALSLKQMSAGTGNVGRLMFLEDGAKYTAFQPSTDDLQWIESRAFGIQEVARFFNISPTKLGDLGRATWSNLESENTSFIEDTLMPILMPIEQEANRKLLMGAPDLFAEHLLEARLRGLTADRFNAYAVAIQAGFLLPSEARRRENLPTVPGIDERPRGPVNFPNAPPAKPRGNTEPPATGEA